MHQGFQTRHQPHKTGIAEQKPKNYFLRALILSLTNPKAILFLLSFFVQFVDVNYPNPYLTFLILAIILQVISLSYLTVLIFVGKTMADKFASRPWLGIIGMMATGLLFLGFAVNMWLAQM